MNARVMECFSYLNVSTEIFEWVNTSKTGFMTIEEFTTCLKSNKVKVSEHSARQLFDH